MSQDESIMEDIPRNPNRLNGPRSMALKSSFKDYSLDDSPSKKSVTIDQSPPKVVQYDRLSSDEEETQTKDFLWTSLPLKPTNKPLPPILPSPESCKTMSPEKDSMMLGSDDEVGLSVHEKLILEADYDHELYLENQLREKRKEPVDTYYNDVLSKTQEEEDDILLHLGSLYDSNVRNTENTDSLRLSLSRSDSLQSQNSLSSTDRKLDTHSGVTVSESVALKGGIHGFTDENVEEMVSMRNTEEREESEREEFLTSSDSYHILEASPEDSIENSIMRMLDQNEPDNNFENSVADALPTSDVIPALSIESSSNDSSMDESPHLANSTFDAFNDNPYHFVNSPGKLLNSKREYLGHSEISLQSDILSIWHRQTQPERPKPDVVRTAPPPKMSSILQNRLRSVSLDPMESDSGALSVSEADPLPNSENLTTTSIHDDTHLGTHLDTHLDTRLDTLPSDTEPSDQTTSFHLSDWGGLPDVSQDSGLSVFPALEESHNPFYDSSVKRHESLVKQNIVANLWKNGTISPKKKSPVQPEILPSKFLQSQDDEPIELKSVSNSIVINNSSKVKGQKATIDFTSPRRSPNKSYASLMDPRATPSKDSPVMGLTERAKPLYQPSLEPVLKNSSQVSRKNSLRTSSQVSLKESDATDEEAEQTPQTVEPSGLLFTKILSVNSVKLPEIHSHNAEFCIVLDNGIHTIKTEYFKMSDSDVTVGKEFELIVKDKLDFILTLKARYSRPKDRLVQVKERTKVRSKNRLSRMFGSKDIITTTKFVSKPADPDPWNLLMATDGSFAKAYIDFSHFKDVTMGKVASLDIPIVNEWSKYKDPVTGELRNGKPTPIGTLKTEMLFLPKSSPDEKLPSSISSALRHLTQARDRMGIKHDGFMFQEGGDCMLRRRRFFKLEGSDLIAHDESTRKPRAKLNLKKVSEVIYIQDGVKSSRNFSDSLLLNDSFRLLFCDGETVDFVAENREEKKVWVTAIQDAVRCSAFVHQPWVKLMVGRD